MALAFLIRLAGWMTARRNLLEMPLFGHGKIKPEFRGPLPSVTVIAPARNEEHAVEAAAKSMVAMEYPELQVVFVDDHSSDRTAELLDSMAKGCERLHVFHNPPARPGWLGKQNAVWHAVEQFEPNSEWLLFTDGDIVFGATVLRDAVLFMKEHELDFLTCIPLVETSSLLEDLALAPRWAHHLECFEYGKLNDARTIPLGIGAFMLVRRDMYVAAGGHAAIRAEQADDAALARLLKKSGAAIGFARAGDQLRCRQYRGFVDAMRNLVRKQRVSCNDSYANFLSTALHAAVQSILPLPLAIACIAVQVSRGDFSLSMTALAVSAFALYAQGARTFALARSVATLHAGAALLHPVCGVLRCWLTLVAVIRKASGKSISWQGRNDETQRLK